MKYPQNIVYCAPKNIICRVNIDVLQIQHVYDLEFSVDNCNIGCTGLGPIRMSMWASSCSITYIPGCASGGHTSGWCPLPQGAPVCTYPWPLWPPSTSPHGGAYSCHPGYNWNIQRNMAVYRQ